MITIGKIREKSGLLIGVIGGALLLFILGSVLQTMGMTAGEANPRGEIYGEPIDEMELTNLIELFTNNMKAQAAREGREFDEQDAKNAEDQAWNEYVRRTLLDKEFEALGIEVGEDEIDAFIFGTDGAQANPMIAQYFPDSLGRGVDMNMLNDFIRKAEDGEQVQNGVDEFGQPTYFIYNDFWMELRNEIKTQRKAMKYVTLIERGHYVTSLEAQEEYYAQNEVKNIAYIFRPYYTSETASLELTEEEFKAFYEENKNHPKYKQKASRSLQYITMDIRPSAEDMQRGVTRLEGMKKLFAEAENDSLFVMANSEIKQFSRTQPYRSGLSEGQPGTYPASIDEEIQNAQEGTVVGPYRNGERVEIAKVLGFQTEKQAWVRHILIKAGPGAISFEDAQKKADSLVAVIKKKNNFVELVKQVSEDPGSIQNNGEYKWFQEGQMVTEFNDFSFKEAIGKLGTVQTTYGIHIVEVLGRRDAKLPYLGVVSIGVEPSEATILAYEQRAKDFWSLVDETPEDFEKIATDSGLFARPISVFEENPSVFGFSPVAQNQILRFGFSKSAKALDISEPIKDGNRYVVVQLVKIKLEGVPDLEDARQAMETDAKNKLIGDRYIKEMGSSTDLNKISSKYDVPVQNAEVTFASSNVGNSGNEPVVIGALYSGLKDGNVTKPIAGKQGVYVVKIVETIKPMATTDYSATQQDVTNRLFGSTSRNALQSLIKYADVKDYRVLVRIGAR
jgi:peptidyl-prolyl cis-trans isomerase D